MPETPFAIFLMGPTAAGKTELALDLHDSFPVEIISVDSSQVYRGMDIGTAKPTPQEQEHAPHRLIDIRDPAESYSAEEFCRDATREMESIVNQGKIPLLVGGTMFYFHALEFGLSDLPSADPDIRESLAAEAARVGWGALHQRLQAVDPESARRIHPNDAQRIQRALEIYEISGQSLSDLASAQPKPPLPYRLIKIALWTEDRSILHARIESRFQAMLELGFIAEVEKLYARGDLQPAMPSLRSVGYRQIWEYLIKKINYSEMTQLALAATRQLAKRQMTWLRRYPGIRVFENTHFTPINECKQYLREFIRE
ncbi:MAG: tRNA (adenosine(37)-N6)-dimethylallyltransferase MiaA [Gammaproteobacteria bacterium]|nr:tRNA (adenosine(37)-N6)-dimethylallyltransferase MiaA [Gammaproteobacteria bacterium]MDH3405645.1 tRNA (adenosine(37)-N6)-dimethylallyltransferase MiaA [Gammaproteobacteria bacterium]